MCVKNFTVNLDRKANEKPFFLTLLKLIMKSVHFIDVEAVKILQSPLPIKTINTTFSPLVDLTATLPGLFPPLSLLRLLPAEPPVLLPVLNLALVIAVEGLEKIVSQVSR